MVERRTSGARMALLGLVLATVGAGAWLAWREVAAPVRAAVRDYLSFRRVEHYEDVLRVAALESGVDPCLLAAVMIVESGGRVDARSRAGALGLFQLTLTSARWRARELGLPEPGEAELLGDPLLSAKLGADNLAWLLRTYDGDVERALCSYNAGARRMKELADAAGGWEVWREERTRAGNSAILAYAHRALRYRDELHERGFFAEFYAPPADETPPPDSGAAAPVPFGPPAPPAAPRSVAPGTVAPGAARAE